MTQNIGMAMALDHVYSARRGVTAHDEGNGERSGAPATMRGSVARSEAHHSRPTRASSVARSHCRACPTPMSSISANLQLSRYASRATAPER